ncbi:MAG: sensor histidine kinase [Aggregatilineales bacterium]
MEPGIDELHSLRRGIRDLVALTTLPAIWVGGQPPDIARGLCDVLLTTLYIDLVYVCLKRAPDGTPHELLRTVQQFAAADQAREVGDKLAPWLNVAHAGSVLSIANPLENGLMQILVAPLDYEAADGFVVAGAKPPHSLTELDRLLLSVAANQAVIALQQAKLLIDLRLANELKLKFLAMISHELRTPLTSIKGFATSLLATDVNWSAEEQRGFIGIINEEADKLTDLIGQLLDLSQLHAGTLRIKPVTQSLQTIVDVAAAQLTTLAHHHHLTIQLAPELPPVMADPMRIAEVLSNLVGNAVKYAPEGTAIHIEGALREGMVTVQVSDEGPGIPPENRNVVFEAFRQLERKSSQPSKGAGLGLAICKGLIEAHHGRIWIADGPKLGTSISFTLPPAAPIIADEI